MISIVHPLSDELLGLVGSGVHEPQRQPIEADTSWRWMLLAIGLIGVFAWATR